MGMIVRAKNWFIETSEKCLGCGRKLRKKQMYWCNENCYARWWNENEAEVIEALKKINDLD